MIIETAAHTTATHDVDTHSEVRYSIVPVIARGVMICIPEALVYNSVPPITGGK